MNLVLTLYIKVMDNTFSELFKIFWDFIITIIFLILRWGGWPALGFVIWYIVTHDEKVDRWVAKIDKFLISIGIKRDKSFIIKDIRSKINSASKKINKEAEGIVTKKVDIRFVNQNNIESFLRKDKVIIRMRHYTHQDKNIVNAIIYYTKTGILQTGKRYLPEDIKNALDLAITKKILAEEEELGTAMEYFSINVLKPKLEKDPDLQKRFSMIELMENKGIFTRILLREIRAIGKILYPNEPTLVEIEETTNFFSFLEPFAEHRKTSGEVDNINEWDFMDNNIQIGILYVANLEYIDKVGLRPYEARIQQKIDRGCKRIYIFGRGDYNIEAIEALIKKVHKHKKGIKIKRDRHLSIVNGYAKRAICVVLNLD